MPDLAPADEELVSKFLLDWEESLASAAPKSAEEICPNRPDLLAELRARIASLTDMDRFLGDTLPRKIEIQARNRVRRENLAAPTIPGYEIVAEIGRGGMGIVHKAKQDRLNRFVAIKTIRGGKWVSGGEIERFKREAEMLARLQHPGIVQIYDILERDGLLCLILEYVDGQSLAETSRISATPPRDAAKLAHEIAITLAAVHASGVLHRDIKPANILLTAEGSVKVSDFGLAKELSNDSGQTMLGDVLGSPSYMAPEQAAGQVSLISERTDVYSIGPRSMNC